MGRVYMDGFCNRDWISSLTGPFIFQFPLHRDICCNRYQRARQSLILSLFSNFTNPPIQDLIRNQIASQKNETPLGMESLSTLYEVEPFNLGFTQQVRDEYGTWMHILDPWGKK